MGEIVVGLVAQDADRRANSRTRLNSRHTTTREESSTSQSLPRDRRRRVKPSDQLLGCSFEALLISAETMRFTLNLLKLWRGLFILDLVSQRLQRESKVTRIQLAKGNVDRPRIGSALSARPRGCWFAHEVPNTANFSVPLKTGIDASRVTSHQNLVSAPFYPPMGNSIFISKLCEQSSKPAPKLKGRAPCPTLE